MGHHTGVPPAKLCGISMSLSRNYRVAPSFSTGVFILPLSCFQENDAQEDAVHPARFPRAWAEAFHFRNSLPEEGGGFQHPGPSKKYLYTKSKVAAMLILRRLEGGSSQTACPWFLGMGEWLPCEGRLRSMSELSIFFYSLQYIEPQYIELNGKNWKLQLK